MGISIYREFKAFSDQPVERHASGDFFCRFAYNRSTDPAMVNEPGQDYLAFELQNNRIIFAVCDGVSQSFIADLAAEYLGQALMDWFSVYNYENQTEDELRSGLTKYLQDLIIPATEKINSYSLPEGISITLRNVLERKRSQGSQSMFVAGLVDKPNDCILLAWMGDSRLRLWDTKPAEVTYELGDTFHTSERWSTDRGMLGELHAVVLPASQISCLAVYSDGLSSLDPIPLYHISDHALQEAILATGEEPASDDTSFLQVWLTKIPATPISLPAPQARLEKNGESFQIHWEPVAGSTRYEVRIAADRVRRRFTQDLTWILPNDWVSPDQTFFQVRAWHENEPGLWSVQHSVSLSSDESQMMPEKTLPSDSPQVDSLPIPDENITKISPSPEEKRQQILRILPIIILITFICLLGFVCFLLLWRIVNLLFLSQMQMVNPVVSNGIYGAIHG